MQFKVSNYRDGSWKSTIRLLTGTIKADWIQLLVEQHLAALPTLKQSVISALAWQAWNVAHDLIWQSCRPGPLLVFPGEKKLVDQIGKEEQVISPPYTCTPLDASIRKRKKRKQGEDNAQ